MSGMAEVLAAHRISPNFICECGADFYPEDEAEERDQEPNAFIEAFEAHQAVALSTAGFGELRPAQEVAWAKGATSAGMNLMALQACGINPNPYRAAELRKP